MQRFRMFGVAMDSLTLEQAARAVLSMARSERGPCRHVVTPNVDHVLQLQGNPEFVKAYDDASLVVIDGLPVVAAARLFGHDVPERVAGSDLVPALFRVACDAGGEPLRVYLLGAAPGVAERAATRIEREWPLVRVVGTYGPPFGFEKDPAENAAILRRIEAARPDVLMVGLGAPKQELWVHREQQRIAAKVALSIGATIDFLAGERARAPEWMRRAGIEWFYRMASEPRRLAGRYAKNAALFPPLLLKEWRQRARRAPGAG